VDERGHIVGEFTGKKIRTLPAAYGDSTALETSDAPDVRALGRTLLKRMKFRGVAKLDFKRGPDGRLHLLELNPRFNLWHHLGAVAGVNLPALVYGDLVGWPRPIVAQAQSGFQWCKPWKDAAAARAAGFSLVSWMPWALRCEAKSGVAWDDPIPLFGAALWRGMNRVQQPQLTLNPASRSDV
jgi:predicted ATP-grasp superfamily ATP-dependent carboligase